MLPSAPQIWNRSERPQAPIVPDGSVTNHALFTVIAIMTFLACICVGLVSMVHRSAQDWLSNVAQEMTVQVAPGENLAERTAAVVNILRQTPGIDRVEAISRNEAEALLSPWLGSELELDSLPIPQLVAVDTNRASPPDIEALRQTLSDAAPGTVLDDHRVWRDQLRSISRSLTLGGLGLLALVIIATVSSIVFATRGAMQANREVIEVLDLVGADPAYIARAFERHFLQLGMKAAIAGGGAALLLFWGFALFGTSGYFSSAGTQASLFLGQARLGLLGHVGVVLTVATVALLTAITSRLTVSKHLKVAR